MKSWLVWLAVVCAVVTACSATPGPSRVSSESASPATIVVVTPSPPSAQPSESVAPRCAPLVSDATASLDPVFDHDIFVRDESEAIAGEFLAGLSAVYADPDTADVCGLFTERGWTEALAFDPRLRAVGGGTAPDKDLVLRIAFEGTYDLRDRPPVVPLDIIFDIPAGAGTGVTRDGLHVDFVFDGDRWRADRVGEVTPENLAWTVLPSPPPPGPPCAGYFRDPDGASFDERAERPWCDQGGLGRTISSDQLVLLTRYPCDTGTAAVLNLGRPLGTSLDPLDRWEFVRDPAGEFLAQDWLTAPYDGHATLPTDATDTGWTNGNVDLWISPSDLDHAVYLVRGDVVERWPRAARSWGVMDCN